MTHPRDIAPNDLAAMLQLTRYPELLSELVADSRAAFGFFPSHNPRAVEYPWIAANMPSDLDGYRIADIGAGVNILPLWLAQRGARVTTIDNHPVIRDSATRAEWNEWGFLDYAHLDARVHSVHSAYEDVEPDAPFNCIYSVSVIEHVPSEVRAKWIAAFRRQLVDGGLLLLTVDLVPDSNTLWNLSEGVVVEDIVRHGNFDGLLAEIRRASFDVEQAFIERGIPESRVDIGFIRATRR